MKILVVGGTGMIGGHAALYLKDLGHDVTISGRRPPQEETPLKNLPFIQGDYVEGTFTKDQLGQFDAIVFTAGNDIRHMPTGIDSSQFYAHCEKANSIAVPRFAKEAKDAGVRYFIHVGSFYPHIAPELVATNGYIRSRKDAAEGVTALADDTFHAISLDAPFVVGCVPGKSDAMFQAYVQYAEGKLGIPPFGPAGGTNFISTLSLAEAIDGAIRTGQNGKVYLVGDENLSFAKYFELFFRAVGNTAEVPSLDQEHPMLPDAALYTGRGNTVSYEPDPAETATLGYRRNDITRAVNEIAAQFKSVN